MLKNIPLVIQKLLVVIQGKHQVIIGAAGGNFSRPETDAENGNIIPLLFIGLVSLQFFRQNVLLPVCTQVSMRL
jgi:hypothetical protein